MTDWFALAQTICYPLRSEERAVKKGKCRDCIFWQQEIMDMGFCTVDDFYVDSDGENECWNHDAYKSKPEIES